MMEETDFNNMTLVLSGGFLGKFQFNTNDLIGRGKFGQIFRGRNMYTYEEVAIKTETIKDMFLLKERYCYKLLGAIRQFHGIPGVPEIYYMDYIGLQCVAMAMELLGPSLTDLFHSCGDVFSLKTVLMIAVQVLSRIEYVHRCKLIHRDIKPDNLLIGMPEQALPYKESTENIIYLIDFGMAKLYVNPVTKVHIPLKTHVGMFGTYDFMSANTHLDLEQSRKDDLESLGYVLLYLVNGTLPWLKYIEKELNLVECGLMKQNISVEDLCNGLPDEFIKYFTYVRELEFYEPPDYDMLKMLFNSAYKNHNFPDDKLFDWSK